MSTIPFTNTTSEGQIPEHNPDGSGDYFLITDYNNDKDYFHAKICEAIKSLSGNSTDNLQILYGGIITDAGSGKINISKGAAIGRDGEGNYRLITIPNLTNVSLPAGWNDERQIWIIGIYKTKLNSPSRFHFNGTEYQYQLLDSYVGDGDTNNLFVNVDPENSVITWGSFRMNGTTFTKEEDRSTDIANKFIGLRDTPSSYSGNGSSIVAVKSDASGLEFIKWGQIPMGCPFPFDGTFPNIPSLPDNFTECDGSIVTDTDSVFKDYRTRNLNGATLSNLSVSNINNTNKSFELSSYNITAINVGDTVVGTGATLPSDCVIASISGNTITLGRLSGTWNGTTYSAISENISTLTSVTVTGSVRMIEGGSGGGSFWDTMFKHRHDYSYSGWLSTIAHDGGGALAGGPPYSVYGASLSILDPISSSPTITPRVSSSTKTKIRRMKYYIRTS